MALTCCPENGFDLRVVIDKAKFECICAVIYKNDFFEVLAYEIDHLFFSVGELQIMVTLVPVVSFVHGIIIDTCRVCRAVLVRTVNDSGHVSRKVSTLTAGAGDDDHSCV